MKNKIANMLWGFFFIAIGVGIAGKVLNLWDFNVFFRGWWTLLIIIPCFISMIKGDFGLGSTMGFVIGVLLLLTYRIDFNFNVWKMIVPAIFIYIGLRILFQNAFRKNYKGYNTPKGEGVHVEGVYVEGKYREYTGGSSSSEYSAIFSSNHIHEDKQFNGAILTSVFGSISLDLRDAIINSDVEINATSIFAGIEIFVPVGVRIKINNIPIFGGVSNKVPNSKDPNAPTIRLNSTCMFGGIDIK